jgi:CheY-like chemotaxis protein/nitrogen-specific signal transduction histidine kinase
MGGSNMQTENSIVRDDIRKAVQLISGRLAHDLNNLLTPLLAYPEMIAMDLPPDSRSVALLKALETAADAAVQMTRRLADLSGVMRTAKRSFDVAAAVDSVLGGFRGMLTASGVQIEKTLRSGLEVHMSQDALSLAVEELCKNAFQALQGSGKLMVRVGRQDYEAAFEIAGGTAPAGTYTVVEIEDDGPGMSADILGNALEPFYAGFGGGKRCGGGLGLSIAHCALRENGAYLALESEEGKGTMASVLIPDRVGVATAAATVTETFKDKLLLDSGEQPRILVVDDEPSIVNLFKLILENYIQGVPVDKASNGAEALEMFSKQRYDVIVMDLHMPIMDGQTAFLEIESICATRGWRMPNVVFCTGYAPRDAVKRAISEGDRHTLLNKPVRSEILVKAVQTRLESKS